MLEDLDDMAVVFVRIRKILESGHHASLMRRFSTQRPMLCTVSLLRT